MALLRADRKTWVAVLVARTRRRTMLSPFFAKCDGILLVDPVTRCRDYMPNADRTSEATCAMIAISSATRLVCGFIADADRDRSAMRSRWRIGSCSCPVDDLVCGFEALPHSLVHGPQGSASSPQ